MELYPNTLIVSYNSFFQDGKPEYDKLLFVSWQKSTQ